MSYPDAAWERAMTVQEVILKALSGELHWFRAAEILGWSPRTLRRWRERLKRTAETAYWIGAYCAPRSAAYRRRKSSSCCACIGSSMPGSTCGIFIRLRDESMA
jgi:hypothetical protein